MQNPAHSIEPMSEPEQRLLFKNYAPGHATSKADVFEILERYGVREILRDKDFDREFSE